MTTQRGSRATSSDDLVVVGELLAALVEALTTGKPEEITALARLLEQKASNAVVREPDPARVAALRVLRERAALLIETLFTTTDRFLHDALDVQTRERGYRPRSRSLPSQLPDPEHARTTHSTSSAYQWLPNLRA